MITELLLLLEEGTVEGVGDGVVKKLEAVEDLNSAAALDADDAPEDAGRRRRSATIGSGTGAGGGGGGGGGVLGLGLDAGVVIRDVDDHQRVELEGQPAARRRRHRAHSKRARGRKRKERGGGGESRGNFSLAARIYGYVWIFLGTRKSYSRDVILYWLR